MARDPFHFSQIAGPFKTAGHTLAPITRPWHEC